MDRLKPLKGRSRGLSVNSISDAQQQAMNSSLDNLQGDLSRVETQWNRILTEYSNPLELALSFLDDTSVGLGHRYVDFKQLKTRIGFDLQEAVNEHFQVLNTNVASYSIAVNAITSAQDNIHQLKERAIQSTSNITMPKGSLKELNDDAMKQNEMIGILSAVEELIQLPEKVEELIRSADYKNAQILLARGFLSATSHDLWALESLQILKQQLELQEHVLFNNLIEELHDIIYSKKGTFISMRGILKDIGLSQEGFSSLENYLYNVSNVDLSKDILSVNAKLSQFLKNVQKPAFTSTLVQSMSISENEFERLFFVLSIVNDLNKLPTALSILANRAKEELHNIILKCTEEVRVNHPSLLKIAGSVNVDDDFGIPVKDLLSVVMRECFWKIFAKFLVAAQGHRVVFDTVKKLFTSASRSNMYKFESVWTKLLDEIEVLLSRYLENSDIIVAHGTRHRSGSAVSMPKKKESPLFTLQHNIEDSSTAKQHANELMALLKDIFPGITITASTELESIYVEEESFEQEEPLVSASIFNMKILLEPYLLFCQATSDIIPSELQKNNISSMKFFKTFMNDRYFPSLEMTFAYFFEKKVESNNPYALENLESNKYVFKAATDFRLLLSKLLYVLNTTHRFREKIFNAVVELLHRFYMYYSNLFEGLFSTSASTAQQRIISVWLADQDIMETESQILKGVEGFASKESELLMKHCSAFSSKERGLRREDILNTVTVDAVIHFLGTVCWILSWLPGLRKVINTSNQQPDDMDVEKLRTDWCIFELNDSAALEQLNNLKIMMNSEVAGKFDEIVNGFLSLQIKLYSAIRFDAKARCIYHISKIFNTADTWSSDVASIELDEHISSLITELKTIENKIRQQLSEDSTDKVFTGIDSIVDWTFINGMDSIAVMNGNGVKRMLKNIKVIQNACQNFVSEPSMIDMSQILKLYSLCGSTESDLFQQIQEGNLNHCSKDILKTVLRLQFSEELQRQIRRTSGSSRRVNSMPLNKRYNDALKRLGVP